MTFDLHNVPFKADLLDVFPVLKNYPVFTNPVPDTDITPNQILRYLILMYSRDSDLRYEGDLIQKRKQAIERSGLTESENLIFLLSGGSEEINAMVTAFFKITRHRKFARYMSTMEAYYEVLDRCRTPVDPASGPGKHSLADDAVMRAYSVKIDLTLELAKMEKALDEMETELFGEDNQLKDTVEASETMIKSDFTGGVAERMARKAAERKNGRKD
jgi:hypothetical protein